jgi:hypothetical protein
MSTQESLLHVTITSGRRGIAQASWTLKVDIV